MRVLVYEACTGGHFLNHAGQVALALANAGAESHIAVVTDAPGTFSFETCIAPLSGKVEIHPIIRSDIRGHNLSVAWQKYSTLVSAVEEVQPDRLYLPTADGVVQLLSFLRLIGQDRLRDGLHVEALLMTGAVAHPEVFSWSERIKRRVHHHIARAGCDTLHHLNPFVRDWELAQGVPADRCTRTMPDPVEVQRVSKQHARERLGLPADARLVGMVGRLDRRKGADLLIEAFLQAETGPNDMLLLWGPCGNDIDSQLRALESRQDLKGRVLLRNEVLDDARFLDAISALDLLALPYRRIVGSSSIVIRAAAAGRPVLTTGSGWAERVMSRFNLGWTFNSPNARSIAALLPECLERSTAWQTDPDVERFVGYNSRENYAAHWTEGYRRAVGLPGDPNLQSWQELIST